MARHEVTLAGHEELAEGTTAFRFEKPAGFAFKAGQSANFVLLEPPPEPNSARRTFSLASAPYENVRRALDRKSTRLNSSHTMTSRMPSSA